MFKTQREYRQQIVDVCRLMYGKNLITSTDGNVSIRYREDMMLITPSGVHKGFLKPEDIIIADLQGKKVSGRLNASSEIHMHVAVYASRSDIQAVIHAHPVYCIAFTLAGKELGKDYLPEVVLSVGEIPIVPYSTPTSDEVPQQIRPYIEKHDALILDRHGSLTLGKDAFDAYYKLERMEHVAQTMFAAHQLGPLRRLTDQQFEKLTRLMTSELGEYKPSPRP